MSSNQQQNKAAAKSATATANTAARLNEALGGKANETPRRDESVGGSADPAAGTVPAAGADEPFEVIAESKTHRVCQSATRAWKEEKPAKPERAA
jgi:hypothetical protein